MKKAMTNKRAGIYDRWLSTLGGGEQVVFAYAQALRDFGYKTDILTHGIIDKKKAVNKMNVDLEDINIVYLPEKSSAETSQYTEDYDLFINTSHLDYFPSRAKINILSVFFPGQIFLTLGEYLKRGVVIPSLKIIFIYPIRYEGFKYDEEQKRVIYKWIGKKSSIVFSKPVKKISLELFIENLSFTTLEQIQFYTKDQEIFATNKFINHRNNTITYHFNLDKRSSITIKLPKTKYENKIALTRLTIKGFRYLLYNQFKKLFPVWEMRLHGGPGITPRSHLESYDEIVTISQFCNKWINNYWRLPSTILYPPVNTKQFKPAKRKKNIIINIGRFFVTGHNKKQLDLVKVFKKLSDQESIRDWELHLVGSVQKGGKHQEYYEQVKKEAHGSPIHIHTDMPFNELQQLLSESKIYWHATGLDEDENKNPILFEHFGITTVEAMASGCVPVVIDAGGQSEIVTEKSGLKWKTRDQLLDLTAKLIKDKPLYARLQKGAINRSKHFSRESFKRNFKKIIKKHSK